jgi:hypothetical protein
MPGSFWRWRALGEPEIADPGLPETHCRSLVILVRVVESAIVHRINGHVAVVAPTILGFLLTPGAVKKMLFTGQDVRRISGQSACITDLRVNRCTGSAKTERNVSLVIRRASALQIERNKKPPRAET